MVVDYLEYHDQAILNNAVVSPLVPIYHAVVLTQNSMDYNSLTLLLGMCLTTSPLVVTQPGFTN